MPHRSPVAAVVLLAAALAALTACAPATGAAPTPTETPATVSPEPVAEVEEPSSRFAFDCDDVAADVAAYFGGATPQVVSTIPHEPGPTWLAGPAQHAFAQSGALYCEFGPDPSAAGSSATATVTLIADGADAVADRDATLGPPPGCGEGVTGVDCGLVEGTYVEVSGTSAESDPSGADAARAAATAAVAARISASPSSPQSWVLPAGSAAPTGCEQVLPVERLAAIHGAAPIVASNPEGGWSALGWMVARHWAADPCGYADASSGPWGPGPFYGGVSWLPGGEWAYAATVEGTPIDLGTSAEGSDQAVLACGASEYYDCAVDVLVSGTWVRYQLPETPEDQRLPLAGEIAAAIVETVRAS